MAINASLVNVIAQGFTRDYYHGDIASSIADTFSDAIQQRINNKLKEREMLTKLYETIDPSELANKKNNEYYTTAINDLERKISDMMLYDNGKKKNALQRGSLTDQQWLSILGEVKKVEGEIDKRKGDDKVYADMSKQYDPEKHDPNRWQAAVDFRSENGYLPEGYNPLREKAKNPMEVAGQAQPVPYAPAEESLDGSFIVSTQKGLDQDSRNLYYNNVLFADPAVEDGLLNMLWQDAARNPKMQTVLTGAMAQLGVPASKVKDFLEGGPSQYSDMVDDNITNFAKVLYKDKISPLIMPDKTERKLSSTIYAQQQQNYRATIDEQKQETPNYVVSDGIVVPKKQTVVPVPSDVLMDESGKKIATKGDKNFDFTRAENGFIYGRVNVGTDVVPKIETVKMSVADGAKYIEGGLPGFKNATSTMPVDSTITPQHNLNGQTFNLTIKGKQKSATYEELKAAGWSDDDIAKLK